MGENAAQIQRQLTDLEIEAEHLLLARHQVNILIQTPPLSLESNIYTLWMGYAVFTPLL